MKFNLLKILARTKQQESDKSITPHEENTQAYQRQQRLKLQMQEIYKTRVIHRYIPFPMPYH